MARIELPGKNLIQGYSGGGEGSPAAAAAPWAALESVGNQVQDQSDQLNQTLVKLQRVKNLKMANEMELKASEEFAAFQREMETNPNPEQWPEQWAKRLDKLKSAYLPGNLAPEQEALLGERYGQFASRSRDSIMEKSVREGIGQARQSAANIIDQSIKTGDLALGRRAIDDLRQTGMVSDPEADRMQMNLENQFEATAVEESAKADPRGTKQSLEEKNEDGTWKNHTNLDPNQRARLIEITKQESRGAMADAVADAQNGMADGSITKPEQLDQRYSGVIEPRVMEKLKANLSDRWNAEKQWERAQPAYQNGVVGKVSSMLADFKAEDADYDEKYVEMDSLVRTLPPGAVKDELTRRLSQVRSGQFNEKESLADMARKTLADGYKGGLFGRVRKEQGTSAAIDAGLLRDRDKLREAGFNDESLEYITGKGADGEYTTDGKKLTDTERRKRFAEKYPQRANKQTAANPFTQAAFDTIQKGGARISWSDADAEKKAIQAYGKAQTELEDWVKLNPDDARDPKKLAEKVYSLASPYGMKNATSIILTPPPAFEDEEMIPGEGTEDLPPLDLAPDGMDPDYPLLPFKPTR